MAPKPLPYDEERNVAPVVRNTTYNEKYNFPSAEGYEDIPDGWKPRSGRELPALRCTHVRDDDTRCKNFGVRGTGFNGTPSMCFLHGGSLPAVKAKAEATVLSARMRLVQNTGLALDTLFELMEPGNAGNIRLKASTEVLDRAGIKGSADFTVDHNVNVSASDEIQKRLQAMSEESDEDIVDAEEVDDEE